MKVILLRLYAAFLRREIVSAAIRREEFLARAGRLNGDLTRSYRKLAVVRADLDILTPAPRIIADIDAREKAAPLLWAPEDPARLSRRAA